MPKNRSAEDEATLRAAGGGIDPIAAGREARAAEAARQEAAQVGKGKDKTRRKTPAGRLVTPRKRLVKPGVDKKTGIVKPLAKMGRAQRESELIRTEQEETSETAAPKQQLKKTRLESKRPSTAGIRAPKRGELKRGKTSIRVKPTKVQDPKTGVVSPYRKPPTVRRNPVTGKAEKITAPTGPKTELTPSTTAATSEQLSNIREETLSQEPKGPGSRAPMEIPKGGLRERSWIDPKTGKASRKLKGFGIPAEHMSTLAWKAMGHLDGLMSHKEGSAEHSQHYLDFHNTHEEVRPHSKDVYTILAMAHKVATAPKYPQQTSHLNMVKDALSERISIGRAMERERTARQGAQQ